MTLPNSTIQNNSFMNLEADFNLAQNQIFRSDLTINNEYEIELNLQNQNFSSENEMYDLLLEVRKHQAIISLTNDESQEDIDNQTFSLDNEINSSQNISDNEESHENPLRLYRGLKFDIWDEVEKFVKSYAFCYTQTRFTASIQSTQCVESMNTIIKKEVSHSSTLLYLVDAIQNHLNEEQLSKYFLYDATEIFYNWDQCLQEPENIVENGCLKDDYERHQIDLKSLLQILEHDDIIQI
ncbi:6039_t:CDS:2 [Racocetra persica]|uniref:6039_t:CDS:1 n=1 Tax=Racocetra persica TaxID=160502 RepID=A0ACA9LRE0_9GLOM|nr:6039_t:CDS:2 [Racocetra persica]